MCGGGCSGPQTSYSYQNAIQPELMPFATQTLGAAQSLVFNKPFQQYTGQMVAGFNPMQQQAAGAMANMQPSAYLGQGAGLAGYAGTRDFSGANVNQYMSPYMQNVVNQQQQGAIRDYSRQLPQLGAGAARAGGLGGSRNAILQAEGQRNLQNQLADIQAKGSQSAYESARNQFNAANQNMLSAAGQLGQFGGQDYSQRMGIAQGQLGIGNQMQQTEQQRLNASYQQFINQQAEPYQRLAFMNSMIRGTPIQNVGSTMYQQPPSMLSQVAGTATGMYGLSQAGKKEGGKIEGYKGGGIVSLARGGSTPVEKMGAIDASTKQLSKSMPPQAANAKVQQTISALPESIDWQNAAAMMAYTKAHPATVEPPKQDSVVVQMAKQIAMQSDAEKMAEAQKAQGIQQEQMAMQQMQQAQQQGVAGLPTPNVGQNFTPNGITAEPQGAPQGGPQVNAAEGGGIADLQADNIGQNYAGGGIVAFSGADNDQEVEDDSENWMDRSNKYFLASQAQQQARDAQQPVPSTPGYSTPIRPAIVANANPNASASSPSILRSTTLTTPEGGTFNRAPYAQSALPSQVGPLSADQQSAAFNRMLNSPTNVPTPAAAQAPTRYDDSRYASAATTPTQSGIAGISRPKIEAAPAITPVEDKRMTDEEYFKKYQEYKDKSGLNKATSDISKFLDNEQAEAAKDAKYERSLALAQFGFDIASTPGGLLRGIAAGGKGYASSLAAIKKEQSATERSLAKSRLELAQSVAKDDLSAWNKGLDNFRDDTKSLEALRMQQKQLEQSAFQSKQTLEQQRYATDVTASYYKALAAASGTKTNATLERYKSLFAGAIEKYAQTNDPKDKAAADHYQNIVQMLVDPTQTKAPAAISAALAKDEGVKMAQLMLISAQQSGDVDAIDTAQKQLEAAKQAVLTTAGFTQQLSNASGTGLNSLGGSTGGGARFVGFEPIG